MKAFKTLVSLVVSASCVLSAAVAQDGPIKIGIVHPYSGPLSTPGTEATNGFLMYFNEIGNKVAGRQVQFFREDTAGNPGQGLERVKRLVEREGVHIVTGITSSAVAYAARDYIHEKQMPLLIMGAAGANDITAARGSPYIFRTSFTNRQFSAPFGPYACQRMNYKRTVIIASDFVTGHEQSSAFEEAYKKSGCEIVKKIMVPMGTTDFAPFLAQIPSSGVDAVWAMFLGQDAIGFVKQYDQLGFKARIPLTGSAGLVYEPLLPAMGRSAVGVQIPTWYTPDFPGDVNKRFVDAYTAQYKTAPGSATAGAYVGAMALAKAIEAVGGKVENKNELLAALRKVNLPSTPQGPFRFDDKQNVIFNLSLVKIVDRSGKYIPELVAPIASNVDQSWAAR